MVSVVLLFADVCFNSTFPPKLSITDSDPNTFSDLNIILDHDSGSDDSGCSIPDLSVSLGSPDNTSSAGDSLSPDGTSPFSSPSTDSRGSPFSVDVVSNDCSSSSFSPAYYVNSPPNYVEYSLNNVFEGIQSPNNTCNVHQERPSSVVLTRTTLIPLTNMVIPNFVSQPVKKTQQRIPIAPLSSVTRNQKLPLSSPFKTPVVSELKGISVKEARKIRNRESAASSRLKQKEALDGLSKRVLILEKENQDLKQENSRLRKSNDLLESEVSRLKKSLHDMCSSTKQPFTTSKRKVISLLAVVFMIGLNLGPYSSFGPESPSLPSPAVKSVERRGRSLLWIQDVDYPNDFEETNAILNSTHPAVNVSSNCQTRYINQTESRRLEDDLRGWVQRVENEQKLKKTSKSNRRTNDNSIEVSDATEESLTLNKKPIPLARMRRSLLLDQEQRHHPRGRMSRSSRDLMSLEKILTKSDFNLDRLLDTIHRRDDTFYFVSFSPDMVMIPAEVNSTKNRPRFSLIMPALKNMAVNSSNIHDKEINSSPMTLMQIDCEVMNTQTVFMLDKTSDSRSKAPSKKILGNHVNSTKNMSRVTSISSNSTRHATKLEPN